MIKIKYLLITLLIIISVLNCEEDNEKNMKSTEFKGWIFFNADMKRYRYIDITIPLESGDVKLSGSNIITYEINRNYFIEDKNNYFPDNYTEVLKISRLVDTQNNKDYILRKTFVKQSNGVLVKDYSEYFSPNGKPTKLLASQNDIIGEYQWLSSPNEKYNIKMKRIDEILGSGIFLNFVYFNDLFNDLKVYDLNKTLPNRENTGIFRTIKLYNYFYYVSYNRDTSWHELSDLEDSANHRTEFETGKPFVEMKYVDEFFDYVRNYKKIIKGLK